MRSKWLIAFHLLLAVGVAWAAGYRQASGKGAAVGSPAPAAAEVSYAFNYQGTLRESGQPVTGWRDIAFSLHTENTCTASSMLALITAQPVYVSGGLFSLPLGFSPDFFNGQALYLKVNVGGTDVACHAILPAPYAVGLRPGAYITGLRDSGPMLTGNNTSTTGPYSDGLYGITKAPQSSGVVGHSLTADGYGVRGVASGGGIAVRAEGRVWSREDTVLMLSPMGLVERDNVTPLLEMVPQQDGSMAIFSNGAGVRYVVLPVQVPGVLLGSRSYVKSLEVCFSVGSTTNQILASSVIAHKPVIPYYEIYAMDDTAHNNTTRQCYTATAAPLRPIENSMWVQFNLDSSTTMAGWIIYTIKLTIGQYE